MNFAAAVVVLAYFEYYKFFLNFLDLILGPSSFSLVSASMSVPRVAIFCSCECQSRGCPGAAHALPMVGMPALASLCTGSSLR